LSNAPPRDAKHRVIDFCTQRNDIGFAFNPASRPAIDRFDVKTVEYPHGLRFVAGLWLTRGREASHHFDRRGCFVADVNVPEMLLRGDRPLG
jgi:hypothetical protein